jgi:hypothetical protein
MGRGDPGDKPSDEKEAFLARWSRRKQAQAAQTREPAPAAKEPEKPLPPVESLTPDSDFSVFMGPKVKDELRRMALKKLFRDPHFSVADPFEPFSGDWTLAEPIPSEMLATLKQTRTLLLKPEERQALDDAEKAQKEMAQKELADKEAKGDEPGRQDT